MLVHKFGGTSVADAARLRAAAALVIAHPRPAVVVTSALGGMTDVLISAAEAARDREASVFDQRLNEIRLRHLEAADALTAPGPERDALRQIVLDRLAALESLLHGVHLLQELSPRSLDAISAFGELIAVELLAAALRREGAPGIAIDARDLIRTDGRHGAAAVDLSASRAASREALLPLAADRIPVVTGFIGRGPDGATTTLGRGGSDYSASLLGAFLDAEEIWIWTDVDGVMTADPRVVPEARVLPTVSYREAAEMAYFGSKVLHPSTMIPAVQAGIPIRIRNSLNPAHRGTLISRQPTDGFAGVKTVTSISDMALVTIEGKGMIGVTGIVGRIFAATARRHVNVYMISQASSEQNITFLVRRREGVEIADELEKEFELEIARKAIERVEVRAPVAILAIIGEGMKGTPGISQRLFTALGRARINVLAIAQGSSELNVSVVVDQADLHRAVGAVHTRFGLTTDTHIFLLGKGAIGRTLLRQLVESRERLRREHGLSMNVLGVAGRDRWLFDPRGLPDATLRDVAAGRPFDELGAQPRPDDEEILRRLASTRRLDVVVVDVTAAETGEFHLAALRQGFHVVTANKKPASGPLAHYEAIRAEATAQGVGYHFETTFGAGLPVLFTLQDLLATHDRVERITGCFSGTLGYIATGLQAGRPFSEVVREAKAKGFTEPDPRDDLSGLDVARKALIIAREIGMKLEMADLDVEGLVPSEFMAIPEVEVFLARLPELDALYAQRVAAAAADGKVLRYVADIAPGRVAVGLAAVSADSPAGQLSGPDNILIYQTERYHDNSLIIRGPGAGAEVTAAGVFGDILKVARHA